MKKEFPEMLVGSGKTMKVLEFKTLKEIDEKKIRNLMGAFK